MRVAHNINFAEPGINYQPYFTLIGDPTFNPGFNGGSEQDLIHIETEGPYESTPDSWTFHVTINVDNIKINLNEDNEEEVFDNEEEVFNTKREELRYDNSYMDVVDTPVMMGDGVFGTRIYHNTKYSNPEDKTCSYYYPDYTCGYEDTIGIVLEFDNPNELIVEGISSAERKVGDNIEDITDLVNHHGIDVKTNEQGRTFVYVKQLSIAKTCYSCSDEGIVGPDTTEIPETEFNISIWLTPEVDG